MPGWKLNLDREDFLARYWQREPLLVKNAVPGFHSALDADELAGLALEEEIESRIIEHRSNSWHLHHGPFQAADFDREPPWTLLVQAVDHHVPEVADLRRMIDFIPQWRVDDVMISYAVDGGSVGPHYDNYDVFLLQGEGTRVWKLGQPCDETSPLVPHSDLRLLADFDSRTEYTLSPGDMLYVPPGLAHWGIARGECMTYSIGFRAPRMQELVSRCVDAFLEGSHREDFYRDPTLSVTGRPGEISPEARHAARSQLLEALEKSGDDAWFGELVTQTKYDMQDHWPSDLPDEVVNLAELKGNTEKWVLNPAAKLAWQETTDGCLVYVNGQCLPHSGRVRALVEGLCRDWYLDGATLTEAIECPDCAILLGQLLEYGCLERG